MKKFLCALAILPFLSATALAQPVQLNETQMDTVSAGWGFWEADHENTSATAVSVYQPGNEHVFDQCTSCFIVIESKAISVASMFLN
jgi:hypothetical protein